MQRGKKTDLSNKPEQEKVRKTDGWARREEGEKRNTTTRRTKQRDKVQGMQGGRRKGKGSRVWNKQIKREAEGVRNGRQVRGFNQWVQKDTRPAGDDTRPPRAGGHATVCSGGQVTSNMSNRPRGEKMHKHCCCCFSCCYNPSSHHSSYIWLVHVHARRRKK